jgi:hypothetical protein
MLEKIHSTDIKISNHDDLQQIQLSKFTSTQYVPLGLSYISTYHEKLVQQKIWQCHLTKRELEFNGSKLTLRDILLHIFQNRDLQLFFSNYIHHIFARNVLIAPCSQSTSY